METSFPHTHAVVQQEEMGHHEESNESDGDSASTFQTPSEANLAGVGSEAV